MYPRRDEPRFFLHFFPSLFPFSSLRFSEKQYLARTIGDRRSVAEKCLSGVNPSREKFASAREMAKLGSATWRALCVAARA